jgi:hypothetical protein
MVRTSTALVDYYYQPIYDSACFDKQRTGLDLRRFVKAIRESRMASYLQHVYVDVDVIV